MSHLLFERLGLRGLKCHAALCATVDTFLAPHRKNTVELQLDPKPAVPSTRSSQAAVPSVVDSGVPSHDREPADNPRPAKRTKMAGKVDHLKVLEDLGRERAEL